ncbi:hypothetical protein A9X03_07130 [Mycobacterium sp. E1715]|uniref:hypothetical protein n=1 Tax=Mycobacterium sp. E1715 TaxID=1856863 RepID=UPI000801DE8A|nr:hypothetical protein [Mycobacterium sp. E1715]OBH31692.1 hypothetical protein A9X03_07130 [Mycobacterium sp. E1715]
MPVDIDAVDAAGGYRLPAGTYAKLLRQKCQMRCEIEYVHSNPRCNVLVDDCRAALVEYEQAEELAAVRAGEMFAELLAAGEPVVVAQWQARQGRPMPGMPAWLTMSARGGGVSEVRVYPDDVAEPVLRR